MKLISLYIENFGGLSRYALDFSEGLTVIEEENGFGKTTLAEFIRAMFYGFPRKGKTLDKSRRQKYTPWNGGKFGGNLVFEAEGSRYRLERSFGATPKADSFSLIDLNTGKKSRRFTEEIGLELFGLDADAYERSTYLPQMAEVGNLTTDSIRSKLSNLVEDTNDVGNYEKAVAMLKSKRSTFVPYRGSGGSVMQSQSRIQQLQEQLLYAEEKLPELENCSQRIENLESRTESLQRECDEIRIRIRRASDAAAVAAAHSQEAARVQELENCRGQLEDLERKYPAGIPDTDRLDEARQICSRLEVLKDKNVTDPEDLEAADFLEANRNRFGAGLPEQGELDDCRNDCRTYFALLAEAEGKGLTKSEREQMTRLQAMFERGLLEKERLEQLTRLNREWEEKGHQRAVLELSEEDRKKKEELECYFASGIPDEMTLRGKEGELEQLRQLRQEQNERIAARTRSTAGNTSPVPMILLLIAGVAAAAAGIVLLARQIFLWGGIGLGIGVLCLLGGIFAGQRMKLAREQEKAAQKEREIIRKNEEKLQDLKTSISGFTVQYSTNDMMAAALYEIRDNRGDYLALLAKQRQFREKQRILDEEREKLGRILAAELGEGSFREAIVNLHVLREQHLDLQQQKKQTEDDVAALQEQAALLLRKIRSFLNRYEVPDSEDLHGALSELERSSEAYRRSELRVRKWQEEKKAHEQELAECNARLEAFFAACSLQMGEDPARRLLQIRDDRKDWENLTGELEKQRAELAAYREENSLRLAEPRPDVLEDPQQLREEETRLNRELRDSGEALLMLKQEQRQLKAVAEEIPALRDDLQMWKEKKASDQHSADVLDDTMAFLEQAKENLSGSYLGPIRQSFREYLGKLWQEQEGRILVTQDLDVLLERYGETRELGYFSAGQADLVMLCMRFALVDALFGKTAPCVILDDPFVNLDDRHAKQALELLKELSENRQILYLTCSSSRTPN